MGCTWYEDYLKTIIEPILEQHKKNSDFTFNTTSGNKWKGILYAILYGWLAKGFFSLEPGVKNAAPASGVTTISFMFLVPFVMGLIIAYRQQTAIKSSRKSILFFMPLIAVIGLFTTYLLWQQDGIIYALIAFPAYAVMAISGSITGHFIFALKKSVFLLIVCLLLPFLLSPLENHFGMNDAIYWKQSTVSIHSSEDSVWKNIIRVKAISEEENKGNLFQLIGFPKPIKAEFDTIAIGGVRKAVFDRGLLFTETIKTIVPNKVLAFNIKADPGSRPVTALEKHVIVDGKYFEVLEGKYEIEKTGHNKINLHLYARYRVSTHFNFYSGFWARMIMEEIQKNILEVVKHRSELERS